MRKIVGLIFMLLALGCAASFAAHAQRFPSKPMRIIVPFPPGAFNDQLARVLAQKLGEKWKQPIVVDNRPGGSTVIGTDLAAKAAPDGHTLLIVSFAFAVNPALIAQLPYDTLKQFTPVVLAAGAPNILVVHPRLQVDSVQAFIARAKAQPGKLDYASAGSGTSTHLCMELLKTMANIDLVPVHYKGSAPAITDAIGGQVKVMFDNLPNALPHVKAGKLRALAVTTSSRSLLAPDVPTLAEAGVPGYDVEVWFGVVAPAGTPKSTIVLLNSAINAVLAMPDVKQRFGEQGVRVIGGTPEQFDAYLREQMSRWAKVVKARGLSME
ncbi:MAG TPA: tripartite tricarboxylate transporter substrate binding protein [Burkholderiales bacterium]|nr:tripartite tricarboxylate transporter substrate binding protein [Burkholderiales bacterium]